MKYCLSIPLLLSLLLFTASCASSPKQSVFTADTIQQVKEGMTKDEVVAMLGQPRSRQVDNDGNELWQYRKNAQEGKGFKTYANIVSLGTAASLDSEFQDILTVAFQDGLVSKATYQENVRSLNPLTNPNQN